MVLSYYGVPIANPDALMVRYFERNESDKNLLKGYPESEKAFESSYDNLEVFLRKFMQNTAFKQNNTM